MNTILRDAQENEFQYIDGLRKKEGSSLGFLPKAVYESILQRTSIAGRSRFRYMCLLVTEDNAELTGFCLATFSEPVARILQIVIQDDARRWHRALLMADEVERRAREMQKLSIHCRVACDLESNAFWRAIGYVPIRQVISTWLN